MYQTLLNAVPTVLRDVTIEYLRDTLENRYHRIFRGVYVLPSGKVSGFIYKIPDTECEESTMKHIITLLENDIANDAKGDQK